MQKKARRSNIREMSLRQATQARPLVALALGLGLLAAGLSPQVEEICPAPMAAMPMDCCEESAPPACPTCPSEGRSSCPAQPAPARTSASFAALPPGSDQEEPRDFRKGEPDASTALTTTPSSTRSQVQRRRDLVLGASPPVQLLACTFRN